MIRTQSSKLGRARLESDSNRLKTNIATPASRNRPEWLVPPITHPSFDADTFSDVGSSTEITRESWSEAIPAGVTALIVQVEISDSSSDSNDCWFKLGPSSANYDCLCVSASGIINTTSNYNQGTVPVDSSASLWYQCEASGSNTLTVTLKLWGWWI